MNILTFDIEDWFHTHENRKYLSGQIWKDLPARIEPNTDRILDLLDELGIKATFFVLGWVAKHHPKLVKRIQSKGYEIGAHSHWHHNAHLLRPDDFEKDLVMCLSRLTDITGESVTAYRAPGFSLRIKDKWAFDIMVANGITVDSSIQVYGNRNAIPMIIEVGDNQIIEFPLVNSTFGFPYSGGGYFRAMPLPLLNYFFREEKYRLLYFHPRDFDPDNPYSNMFSLFRNKLNNINTKVCMNRLRNILDNQDSITIGEAVDKYLSSKIL